jgi:hypothetical protein
MMPEIRKKANPDFPYHYHSSSVILQSDWWITGRIINLWANVELPVPREEKTKLDNISEKAQMCIQRLGKVQKEEVVIVPSLEEEQEMQTKKETSGRNNKMVRLKAEKMGRPPSLSIFPVSITVSKQIS